MEDFEVKWTSGIFSCKIYLAFCSVENWTFFQSEHQQQIRSVASHQWPFQVQLKWRLFSLRHHRIATLFVLMTAPVCKEKLLYSDVQLSLYLSGHNLAVHCSVNIDELMIISSLSCTLYIYAVNKVSMSDGQCAGLSFWSKAAVMKTFWFQIKSSASVFQKHSAWRCSQSE